MIENNKYKILRRKMALLFYFDISVNILLNDNLCKSMDNIQKLGKSKKVK